MRSIVKYIFATYINFHFVLARSAQTLLFTFTHTCISAQCRTILYSFGKRTTWPAEGARVIVLRSVVSGAVGHLAEVMEAASLVAEEVEASVLAEAVDVAASLVVEEVEAASSAVL